MYAFANTCTKWSHNIIIFSINSDKFSLLWWQMVSMLSEVLRFVSNGMNSTLCMLNWSICSYTIQCLLHWPRATGKGEMQE